jgi:hypothetical protein
MVSKVLLTVDKLIIKLGFWSGPFGGGAAESYDSQFWAATWLRPYLA